MSNPTFTYREGQVVLADRDGNVGLVAPNKVSEYLDQGFTPVANTELSAAEKAQAEQDRLKTPLAKVGTGLRAVAEGAGAPINWAAKKLGAPDLFNAGLTPEQVAENQAMEGANPLTAMAGHMVGEIAGLKGFGIAKAAGAAGKLTTNALARGAITAGVEGAGLGTIGAMEDPDASAEHVLASGALGGILGAGTGLLFSGAGRGLAKIFGKPELSAEAAAEGGGFEKAKDAYNTAVSAATKTDKALLEEVGAFGTRRAEAESASRGIEEHINKQALEMQPIITEVDRNVDAITRRVRDSYMKEESLRKIAGENFSTPERLTASRSLVQGTYDEVAPILGQIEKVEAEHLIPAQTRKELTALKHELEEAAEKSYDEGADALSNYMVANGIKQKLDTVVKGLRNDVHNPKMPMSHGQSGNILQIASSLQGAVDRTREALQSEALWGKAVSSAQKDVNEIWHGGAIKALNEFGKNFMRNTGEEAYETGRHIFENDPAQTARALKALGSAENFIPERAMNGYIEHVGNLVETIGKKYGLKGESQELVETTLRQLQDLKTRFGAVQDQAQLAAKYQKMVSIEAQNRGVANALPILGGVVGGPVGAGVGLAARQILSPASTAQHMVQLARAGERITTMTNGVRTWLSKGAESISEGGRARTLGISSAIHLWRGSHKTDQDAFQEHSKTVLAADVSHIGPHIEGLPPAVQAAAGGQAARALQYLQAILPANAGKPSIMNPSRKVLASVPDQQKFAKAWATVVDPSTALKDLKRGQLSPIQVQALKTVYPKMYDELRLNTLQGIAQADASGVQIPLHTRQQLSLLLDLNGAGQPAFSDQMVGIIQQGLAQQNKPPSKQKTPQLSKSMNSSSKELLG